MTAQRAVSSIICSVTSVEGVLQFTQAMKKIEMGLLGIINQGVETAVCYIY